MLGRILISLDFRIASLFSKNVFRLVGITFQCFLANDFRDQFDLDSQKFSTLWEKYLWALDHTDSWADNYDIKSLMIELSLHTNLSRWKKTSYLYISYFGTPFLTEFKRSLLSSLLLFPCFLFFIIFNQWIIVFCSRDNSSRSRTSCIFREWSVSETWVSCWKWIKYFPYFSPVAKWRQDNIESILLTPLSPLIVLFTSVTFKRSCNGRCRKFSTEKIPLFFEIFLDNHHHIVSRILRRLESSKFFVYCTEITTLGINAAPFL